MHVVWSGATNVLPFDLQIINLYVTCDLFDIVDWQESLYSIIVCIRWLDLWCSGNTVKMLPAHWFTTKQTTLNAVIFVWKHIKFTIFKYIQFVLHPNHCLFELCDAITVENKYEIFEFHFIPQSSEIKWNNKTEVQAAHNRPSKICLYSDHEIVCCVVLIVN